VNNIRLPGQYYDSETGFHYNHFRYYDPRVGRYVTPDPIGQSGGINLFTYALCNPVNATDPLGLFGLGGAIGGAFTFFGYRGAIDFELRIIKDLDKSLFSGWSLGLTYTYSWTNYWEDHQCEEDKPFAWGIEGDVGTRVMLTNANNIGQILGNSVSLVGAGGGLGPYGGSVEMSVMTEENHRTPIRNGGDPVWELAASAYPMPGWALGGEAHLKTRNVTRGLYTIGQR
jgi:RHS repeat-associated protein